MTTILTRIVASKRAELASRRQRQSEADLARLATDAPPPRPFEAALRRPGIQVIAEVKKASPSAGSIQAQADVVAVALTYAEGGAACISVLTDGPFFQGSLDDLRRVRAAVDLPLLRKDFIVDRYQVLEARAAGADAVLLIAEILDDQELVDLQSAIKSWGMAALVECHEAVNLGRVIASGAALVGINNRNLHTFETRLEHTLDLASQVPADRVLISESGIRSRADVVRLEAGGVKAILVGETLMRAGEPARMLRELRGVAT
jgi:indole-3-glycerol phosphate synthase